LNQYSFIPDQFPRNDKPIVRLRDWNLKLFSHPPSLAHLTTPSPFVETGDTVAGSKGQNGLDIPLIWLS